MDEGTRQNFARVLRQLRAETGMSQRQLARQVPISQATLSRYESGSIAADAGTAARLDELLGAGGRLHLLTAGDDDVDQERLSYVRCRPRTVDRATLDSMSAVLASTRTLEDMIGAAPVLQPVRGHLRFVETLVRDAHGPIRRDVVDQAGQWAEFAGWLHTAVERYDEAGRWFSRSLEWSIEAEDDDLAATVWSFKGHVAWLLGHPGPTIGLSQVARRYRGIYTGQLAYDTLQEARGHAALGDTCQVERLVDESRHLADDAVTTLPGAPPWHYYRSPAFWDLERGRALYMLPGRAQKAIDHLTAGLEALPPEQTSADWVSAYRRDLEAAQLRCG